MDRADFVVFSSTFLFTGKELQKDHESFMIGTHNKYIQDVREFKSKLFFQSKSELMGYADWIK